MDVFDELLNTTDHITNPAERLQALNSINKWIATNVVQLSKRHMITQMVLDQGMVTAAEIQDTVKLIVAEATKPLINVKTLNTKGAAVEVEAKLLVIKG